MPSGAFFRWYTGVSDSIRHEAIERPWYGRSVTGSAQQDTIRHQQDKAFKKQISRQSRTLKQQKSVTKEQKNQIKQPYKSRPSSQMKSKPAAGQGR